MLLLAPAATAQVMRWREDLYQFWIQGRFQSLDGTATYSEQLGAALAEGDFNLDGYQDLAIGEPGATFAGVEEAGAVHVLYGSPLGLAYPAQLFTSSLPALGLQPEAGARFGAALAAGDFNGDGREDLAIGTPGKDIGSTSGAGAVVILYGQSAIGLQAAGAQFFHQNSSGFIGDAEAYDLLGGVLAAGNFNGDYFMDLAISALGENSNRGTVQVIYDSQAGLRTQGMTALDQDRASVFSPFVNMPGTNQAGDHFGASLVVGNFNGDTAADLAIGVPGDSSGRGGVNVVFGFVNVGLDPWGAQLWSPITLESPVPGNTINVRGYGSAVAAGDFNHDGRDELAVGLPLSAVAVAAIGAVFQEGGAVHVLAGGANGPTSVGAKVWTQEVSGVPEDTSGFDHFGGALASGDFDGNGFDDLFIAAPGETIVTRELNTVVDRAGAVTLLYGGSVGLSAAAPEIFTLDTYGWWALAVRVGREDAFGRTLVAGDFNGDGREDLAVGSPQHWEQFLDQGSVCLVYRRDRVVSWP